MFNGPATNINYIMSNIFHLFILDASLEAPVVGSVTLSGGGGGSGLLFVGGSEGLGPVCDREFDLVDGEVACRQLGYEGVVDVSQGS